MILAGDIGGTKTVLGLYALAGESLREVSSAEFASASFPGLEPVLRRFLESPPAGARGELRAAGFGVAGPVIDRRVQTTNLPWVVDARGLEHKLGVPVRLMNDLSAMAMGIAELPPEDFATLQPGSGNASAESAAVLIAAGTGLGEAILFRSAGRTVPLPSEGGHADLAARNEEEIALLRFLIARHGRADYEHVLSGPGLVNCYRFTHDAATGASAPVHQSLLDTADPAAAISSAALARSCPACVRSLELFVSIYGAEAGNLALKAMALGGVYVGGGIAPKILPALADGRFIQAFRDKGEPFSDLLAGVPVRVILNPRCALLGAGRAAAAG